MNYQIKKGDTLSQIVANKYGVKGSDVQKYYTEIARINNIKDPNLIYTGDEITLPDNLFDEEQNTTSTGKDNNKGLALSDSFNIWIDNNNSKLDDLISLGDNLDERYSANILSKMTPQELEMAYGDINATMKKIQEEMEDVNASEFTYVDDTSFINEDGTVNTKEYIKEGAEFAQSLSESWESDGEDGTSYSEYFAAEIARLGNNPQITQQVEQLIQTAFNMQDLNNDGILQIDEIQSVYTTIDMADGSPDGKINFGTYGNAIETAETIKKNAINFKDKYMDQQT